MSWLGIDIGGANLKAASADGWARSISFALWRDPDGLKDALTELVAPAPSFERLAVTMTGELCDCYRTKGEGVASILASVRAMGAKRDVSVYLNDGRFVSVSAALETPLLAAASNWRAIAELACRCVPGRDAVLFDIGSTTTDIIPIVNGCVAAQGRTDTERLLTRELVYSGVGRTPVCALTSSLPVGDRMCPVAAEVFSTAADAYLLLGDICEDATAKWTADGRPLTVEFSSERLARQVCSEAAALSREELNQMAAFVRAIQQSQLAEAGRYVTGRLGAGQPCVVLGGSGEFLGRLAATSEFPDCPVVSFADRFGASISQCAAAFALALLSEKSI